MSCPSSAMELDALLHACVSPLSTLSSFSKTISSSISETQNEIQNHIQKVSKVSSAWTVQMTQGEKQLQEIITHMQSTLNSNMIMKKNHHTNIISKRKQDNSNDINGNGMLDNIGSHLSSLLSMQNQLEKVIVMVTETKTWKSKIHRLQNDIENGQNMHTMSERVGELQASLHVLSIFPQNEERVIEMDHVLKQVQARVQSVCDGWLALPPLYSEILSFTAVVALYAQMDQLEFLQDSWITIRKNKVHTLWYSYSSSMDLAVDTWLVDVFYPALDNIISTEMESTESLPSIMTHLKGTITGSSCILSLLEQVMIPLSESLTDRLQDISTLSCFLVVYHHICKTTSSWMTLISDQSTSALYDINRLWEISLGGISKFAFDHYQTLEEQECLQSLNSHFQNVLVGEEASEMIDENESLGPWLVFARRFVLYTDGIESILETSLLRCLSLSNGLLLPLLFTAIRGAMDQHILQLLDDMKQLLDLNMMKDSQMSCFHATLSLLHGCGKMYFNCTALVQLWIVRSREMHKLLCPLMEKVDEMTWQSSVLTETHLITKLGMVYLKAHPTQKEQVVHWSESLETANLQDFNLISEDDWGELYVYVTRVSFTVLFHPIQEQISRVSKLAAWSLEPLTLMGGDDLPTMGHLPQDYISDIANSLLSLLPQLEPIMDQPEINNEACLYTARVGLQHLLKEAWTGVAAILQVPTMKDVELELHDASFADVWTVGIGAITLAALTETWLLVSHYSLQGTEQWLADWHYFQNVLQALSIPLPPLLTTMEMILKLPLDAVSKHVSLYKSNDSVLYKLGRLLAKKRGILVDYDDE